LEPRCGAAGVAGGRERGDHRSRCLLLRCCPKKRPTRSAICLHDGSPGLLSRRVSRCCLPGLPLSDQRCYQLSRNPRGTFDAGVQTACPLRRRLRTCAQSDEKSGSESIGLGVRARACVHAVERNCGAPWRAPARSWCATTKNRRRPTCKKSLVFPGIFLRADLSQVRHASCILQFECASRVPTGLPSVLVRERQSRPPQGRDTRRDKSPGDPRGEAYAPGWSAVRANPRAAEPPSRLV